MKKIIWLLPTILYPYSMLFFLYCVLTGSFWNDSTSSAAMTNFLISLGVLFLLAVAGNIIFILRSRTGKCNTGKLPLINMLVKLIHVPAYILIFALSLLCMITIFTMAFSIFFLFFDCLTIFLSGMTGLTAVIALSRSGKCTKKFMFFHGILQFLFVADVISAIIIYRRGKHGKPLPGTESR